MDVLELLKYCLPSGFLASMVTWLVNKKLYHTRTGKEVHDIYKTMYEDLNETIINQQKQTNELRKTLSKLQQILVSASSCKYYPRCPMRLHYKENRATDYDLFDGGNKASGKRDAPAARSAIDGQDEHWDGEPP